MSLIDEAPTHYSVCKSCGWNHHTGRSCTRFACPGKLRDTIVNFGDGFHDFICGGMLKADFKCRVADLCICLGNVHSLSLATSLPLKSEKRIVVNIQETDFDKHANIRLWTTADNFFKVLMPALGAAVMNKSIESDFYVIGSSSSSRVGSDNWGGGAVAEVVESTRDDSSSQVQWSYYRTASDSGNDG